MKSRNTSRPTWNDVKAKLADFDHAGLIGLVQSLYAASKDNQAFLHARFSLSDDVLKPYKAAIDRSLWPDMFKNQSTSVAKAKKAISNYKKAIGQPRDLAELTVFYCDGRRVSVTASDCRTKGISTPWYGCSTKR